MNEGNLANYISKMQQINFRGVSENKFAEEMSTPLFAIRKYYEKTAQEERNIIREKRKMIPNRAYIALMRMRKRVYIRNIDRNMENINAKTRLEDVGNLFEKPGTSAAKTMSMSSKYMQILDRKILSKSPKAKEMQETSFPDKAYILTFIWEERERVREKIASEDLSCKNTEEKRKTYQKDDKKKPESLEEIYEKLNINKNTETTKSKENTKTRGQQER